MTISILARRTAFGLAAAAALALPAQAQTDFSGETIEWVIPFSETGGSARWANFFAPLLSEELPGNPTVVVRFMPGAGSTKGANWFQDQEHDDGTLLFGTSGSTQFPYLLDDPRVRYEYKDWIPVMASGTGGVAYLNAEDGAKFDGSANALKDKTFIYGSQGATRLDLVPLLAWEMLGMNVEPVFGIQGRGDGRLMFERGEATIDYQTSAAYLSGSAPLVEAGTAVPMMSWGALDEDGNIVRDPTFPDLPSFVEAYETLTGNKPSGADFDAYVAFFTAGFPAQKMIFLPKDTPAEIVAAYQAAVPKMKADPDYVANKEAVLGTYEQVTGKAAATLFKKGTQIDPALRKQVVEMLAAEYGVKLGGD